MVKAMQGIIEQALRTLITRWDIPHIVPKARLLEKHVAHKHASVNAPEIKYLVTVLYVPSRYGTLCIGSVLYRCNAK